MAAPKISVPSSFPQQDPVQYTGELIDSLIDTVNRVDQPVPSSIELPQHQEDDIELERRLRGVA